MNERITDDDGSALVVKRKPRLGCLAQAVALTTALALLGSAAFFIWYSVATKRLHAATSALENAGYHSSIAELIAAYEEPMEGQNPAELWLQAAQRFGKYDQSYAKLPYIGAEPTGDFPTPGEPWAEYEISKSYVAEHAEGFAMMEEAAAADNPARFTVKLVASNASDLTSWLTGHRSMARAVQLRCTLHAYEGKLSEAVNDIQLGLAIGRSLEGEWSNLRSLVGLACTRMAVWQIQEHLHLDFNDQQLQETQVALRNFEPMRSLHRSMEGELLNGVAGMQDPRQVGPIPRHDDAAFLAEQGLLLLNAVESRNWTEITSAAETLGRLNEDLKRNPQEEYMLSAIWLPSMQSSMESHVDVAAELVVHDALVGVRRFQLKTGHLPSSLDELVPDYLPEVPIDPWSPGKSPLQFETKEGKATIYSVGQDRIDDGGDSATKAGGRQKDVVAVLDSTK